MQEQNRKPLSVDTTSKLFPKKGIQSPDPRVLFDKHLIQEMKTWVEQGDSIIIGIDMNGDVRKGELAMQLRRLDMRDLILHQHESMSPPSTYNQNQNRTPIDALWGSMLLDVERLGYRPFNQELPSAPSDGHRMIWVEFTTYPYLVKMYLTPQKQSMQHDLSQEIH